jgi:hypothetical protein
MKYTLYIDESGDFTSKRGQWVVSGVLLAAPVDECKKKFRYLFADLPQKLKLHSIADFHLTALREKFGHSEASRMADATLSRLNLPELQCKFLSTINYSKTSIVDRELTYRLMLTDLLALCETVIPENERISSLDIIVASRTVRSAANHFIKHKSGCA